MGAGDIDAVGVIVSNMGSFETIFDVIGDGSTAMVMNLLIADNDFTSIDPPIRWTAITIRDNASGSFVDTVVRNSTNIRHVFSASMYSSLDIRRADLTDLTGGRAVVSLLCVIPPSLGSSASPPAVLKLRFLFVRIHWMPVHWFSETLIRRSLSVVLLLTE